MKKVYTIKKASASDSVISDKSIQKNREDMGISNKQQDVVGKNINLSLPVKNKDNTIPFNVQLDASRNNKEVKHSITEASMNKKEILFNSKDKKQVIDINVETQKYDTKKTEAFKKVNKSSKDKNTDFWDKYVGVQLEGEGQPTKVKKNIPTSASQLQNNPDRFQGKDVNKMVMASIKDADGMLFHIYATASKEKREVNKEEKQQIIDINSGKTRLIAQMVQPFKRSLEYSGDPIIKQENGKVIVYEQDGTKIDEFSSCEDAKSHYPEGDIQNG